jgi:hypothetical protein
LREFRRKLSRIDPGLSKTTLAAMADLYLKHDRASQSFNQEGAARHR